MSLCNPRDFLFHRAGVSIDENLNHHVTASDAG
jgi:predicted restriction endonuclease